MSALPTSQPGWTDADWDALLDQIAGRQVIPIIGQDLLWLTLDGVEATLATHVARRLAGRLEVEPGESVHAVVCRYLKKEGCQYGQVYRHVHEILRDPALPVPPALAQLAEITDFTLYISTTVDPLLERALDAARFGGERRTRRIVFTPKKRAGLPDGFDAIKEPTVFYALGQAVPEKGPALPGSFVVSEEDLLEFLHALRASEGNDDLDRQVQAFSDNYLLLLGGGFSDWVTRFFLRFTRKERLYRPDDHMGEYLAEVCNGDSGLIHFLQHFRLQSKLFC